MSKPEQTVLHVAALLVTGSGKHGPAETFDAGQFDTPDTFSYWHDRGYKTELLTPLAEAQAEIERLTAEHATALERQALYLALTRDAQRVATEASARAEAALADAERWAPVPGFEDAYSVSSIGRVRSNTRMDSDGKRRAGRYLVPSGARKDYLKVGFWKAGHVVEEYLHRIVAAVFIENPEGKPQVNHKDGDPANNAASNLEWVTNSENQIHARRILAKNVRSVYGISLSDGSRVEFLTIEQATEVGFKRANIQKCIAGERHHHKGYRWFDAALAATVETRA